MRKSFTWLSSLLVLLLLSIQMVMAVPTLVSGGLKPADGGILDPTPPVNFTLTFTGNVTPGEGQIIGLYNNSGIETKAIQLRAADRTINGSVTTYTHADGVVTFNGKVVTISFPTAIWQQKASYWITVGPSAIKDDAGNFNAAAAFGNARWEFTIKDLIAPKAAKLFPADNPPFLLVATQYNQSGTPGNLSFAIKFDEDVKFVDQNSGAAGIQYTQMFGDFAIYTSSDNRNTSYQEGGDLITLLSPVLSYFDNNSPVTSSDQFDSLVIDWTRPSLPAFTDLYVRVKPGMIEDLSGNDFAGMNNETLWNFTTKDDVFAKPTITFTSSDCGSKLRTDNNFLIDFDNAEVLHYATTGLPIPNNADLKQFITIVDNAGVNIPIGSAKLNTSTNTITVDPSSNLVSSGVKFKVTIVADCFKDASGNLSKSENKTFDAGNWDAPTVVSQRVTNQSGTTIDFLLKTSEPCAVHYIVVRQDRAYTPGQNEIFGRAKSLGAVLVDGSSNNDVFYRFNETAPYDALYAPDVDNSKFLSEGNLDLYYGKQKSSTPTYDIVEIFAEGNIIVTNTAIETLKRITGLPATHGITDSPSAKYEIWYTLIDTLCTQGAYASDWWTKNSERISAPQVMGGPTVFTTDILMPEAWFDGDSSVVTPGWGKLNPNKLLPANVYGVGDYDPLGRLEKAGKIYINFNEPIKKSSSFGQSVEFSANAATQNTELQACLWVYQGSPAPGGLNTDAGWSTNSAYTAALSADKKQIIITPQTAWASGGHVWVKIRNSKISDSAVNSLGLPAANEIVPINDLYTQEYRVEWYTPPLVRYTFNNIFTPLDSMLNVPFNIDGNPTKAAAPITVTVSGKIYSNSTGQLNDGYGDGVLVPFSNDTTSEAYIGKFFKIRKGTETSVTESMGDAIEKQFIFNVDYNYGDSTKITITPKVQYDSEIWYFVQIDNRIADSNLRTILQGASTDNNSWRPVMFKLENALTGNATVPGWVRASSATDDNQTAVFKTEDSRNPLISFYTKKQSTLLSNLINIDKKTDINISDTIGVYIDEYVSLGFDHYIHFDAITGSYVLDANAMRRYFRVFDDSVTMHEVFFDVVGLDISALANDSLIFYIDPYKVNADGTAKPGTEGTNFDKCKKYWVYFNSKDADDQGIEANWGKSKGIYWDPNHNMVLDKWASFTSNCDPAPACITSVITPAPGATNLDPSAIAYIQIAFNYATENMPCIQITEGASAPFTVAGAHPAGAGNHNIIRYPVTFLGDSTYTVTIGDATGCGQVNFDLPDATQWPLEACLTLDADSTWTYKMVDVTPPALDTLPYIVHNPVVNASKYPTYLMPEDDAIDFDETTDIVMVFTEEVQLVSNKRLTIYNSANETKAVVLAQQCQYGKHADGKVDKHVIVVPSGLFASGLIYDTHYHINIDNGFVTDYSPLANKWEGIWVADGNASGGPEDLLNDWSFMTGSDPAPYFTKFTPANGTAKNADGTLPKFTVTFSEEVYAEDIAGSDEIIIYEVQPGHSKLQVKTLDVNDVADVVKQSAKVFQLAGFTPVYGKQYCLSIPAGAFIDGNGSILEWSCDTTGVLFDNGSPVADQTDEDVATWYASFRDDVRPFVKNNWPRNNAKRVPYNAYCYIEFSEPVSLNDGSAVIPDPNLLTQTIQSFITIPGLNTGEFDVEFVGNNKKLIRITMMDPAGYRYDPAATGNPTMKTCSTYTVNLLTTNGTYFLSDIENNILNVGRTFTFNTEDVTAPVISAPSVAVQACTNKFDFQYTLTEACSDSAYLYYVVLPASVSTPSAQSIFDQNTANAVKKGKIGKKLPGNFSFTVDMGDWTENPSFKLHAVVMDNEKDIWAPVPTAPSAWDSLFFFNPANGYGEGYDRIADIVPSPNKNNTVVSTGAFMIWDDDVPTLKGQSPTIGQLQVPVNADIKFWFSEAVDAGNVAGMPDTIYLRRFDNNIAVAAVVTWPSSGTHADSMLVINPVQNLDQETKYYIEFDRYAIEDVNNVCVNDDNVYYPQMVGRGNWFKTQDNIGPRWVSNSPADNDKCVSCESELNKYGTDFITVNFYDNNEVRVANNPADPYVYLYRIEEDDSLAWDVIPASEITVVQDTDVDTLWHVKIPLHHQYYPNDSIRVEFKKGLIVDQYNNKYTYPNIAGSNQDIVWRYLTCNTLAPEVTWSIHSLSPFFNYSAEGIETGIYGNWAVDYMTGNKGDIKTGVPTHIALKVDFGETVAFNTSGSTWEPLSAFVYPPSTAGLTEAEIFSILKVGDLIYNNSVKQMSILNVSGNTITIGLQTQPTANNLPVNTLLKAAQAALNHIGPLTVPSYLQNFYKGSLFSNKTYAVTIAPGTLPLTTKVRATTNCVPNAARYVEPAIVTLTTRDDTPPTVSFVNDAGTPLCGNTVCIEKKEPITVKFSGPVVKSSFDVSWLGEESFTFDNLALNAADFNTTVGHYLKFYQVDKLGIGRNIISGPLAVTVTLDPAKTNYRIVPVNNLVSEAYYELVFQPFTVKRFIENDANGTVYEGGDTCRFQVGDHEVPIVNSGADADGFTDGLKPAKGNMSVSSDINNLYVVFNEAVKLGTNNTLNLKVRPEIGSIIKNYTPSMVTLQNKNSGNADTLVIPVSDLAQFTKYYVEMDPGFITDDNTVCDVNAFAGFAAKLDPATRELLSADWWFKTTDATPPELISVVGSETERDPFALYPQVGDTVSRNSNLVLIFDENVHIHDFSPFTTNNGIVIYHDNGDLNSFGNAVEYISWQNQDNQITFSGTNEYNGLTSDIMTIDPETVFDSKGIYYVRMVGNNVFDDGENVWSASTHPQLDEITDHEWWFRIVNDVAPVLVETIPAYDGVATPRTYVPVPADPHGFVKTDLTMKFKDAIGGTDLIVARGDATRKVRIFEYTYDAAAAQYKEKPWITLPITDPSIIFSGNTVTIKDVVLRDGINGMGTSLIKDSVYYVQVDPGAVLNGYAESQTWWPGISNGFRWRFQTASDNTFVGEEDIISPNLVDNGEGAKNLTILAASTLEVKYGEAIEAIPGALGRVIVSKVGETTPAVPALSIPVTQDMIQGADKRTLKIPLTGLVDETSYWVQIQAGAFGDTSSVSTLNTPFGGTSVWQFQTGDNTPPDAVTKAPTAGCVGSSATLTMTFNESRGVVKGAGILTVKNPEGTTVAQVLASDVLISQNGNTVTASVTGLPDTTLLTVTVPAGFLLDGDLHSALPNPVISWTFTTGENTVPTVVSITPAKAVTPSTLISIKFSEKVVPSTGNVTIGGNVVEFTSTDSITYTYTISSLVSESTYAVVVGADAFKDLNAGCTPNQIAKTDLSFTVDDIIAPVIVNVTPKAAADYKLLKLEITFSEAVTPKTGNVVIYSASTDTPIETIASSAFTASVGNTVYSYSPANVKFGNYYILVDAGAFTDIPAAAIAQDCAGISSKTEWPLVISDPSFVDCYHIISPLRATANVPVATTVVIDFCDERIAAGVGKVTIGDQSVNRVLDVNYFEYAVVASMISGNKLSIPVTGLKENTTYSIIIPRGAITDEAGNPFIGITDANLWIFTTGDFTNPVVTVNAATIIGNDGIDDQIAITSSEAGKVYLAESTIAANETALMAAILVDKAVYAVVTTGGVAVTVNAEGLKPGTYKAYGFDASGKMGTAVNTVIINDLPIVPYKTIKQIQGEVAASPLNGTRVRTNGTITAVTTTGFYMQDANAAWSGIFVSSTKPVAIGSSVEVIGTVAEVSGMTTIGTVEEVSFIGPVVTPVAIPTTVALSESLEGVLVKVKGKVATGAAVTADWTAGTYTINNALYGSYTTKKDFTYEVTGIEIPDAATYKVLATVIVNFSELNSVNNLSNAVKVYPNPFDKYITLSVSNDVVITKAVITNIAGQLVKEVINPNNTIPTSELRSGVYFISLHTVDGIAKTERIIKR